MPADIPIARYFLIGGLALALIGLALWWALPFPLPLPPYLFTALLALAYGAVCWKKSGPPAMSPPAGQKDEARE